MDGGGFYSDDEDFGGQIVYGDSKPLGDLDSQSQDDRDLDAAVHTKFNVAARKRLGLGRRGPHQPDPAFHLGSVELEEQLRQQPPGDFKQGLRGILAGLNASEPSEGAAAQAPPPPPVRRAAPPPAFPSRRAAAPPASPVGATAPSPARSLGFQLTAGSQLGGPAGATAGGTGAPRSTSNPFGVDIEMIHIFNYHNTAAQRTGAAPRGGGGGRRAGGGGGGGRQHRQFAQTQAAAAAAAAAAAGAGRPGDALTTPRGAAAPSTARADPLAALLSSGGRGGGSGARGGRPTPSNTRAPPLRGASRFRQPALGTPGPGTAGHPGYGAGAAQGGMVMDVIEPVEDAEHGYALMTGAAATAPAPPPPPPGFETPRSAPQTGPFDSPAGGSSGAGSGVRAGSGQDAFLAGLAAPSARPAASRQRSRMAGGAPNSLQARLKRVLEADESVAAARQQARTFPSASAGRGALEATVQAREMEMGVYKVRGILTEGSGDPGVGSAAGPAFFFIPGHTAREADLAPGKRMRVSPPWRQIGSQGGSTYVMCSGAVETL